MRRTPILLLLVALASLSAGKAAACRDAGAPTRFCLDGGAEWVSCATHDDCPSGTVCGYAGSCQCDCPYGETCEGAACRCAAEDLTAPDGCWVEESLGGGLCRGDRTIVCFDEADCTGSCSEARSCETETQCSNHVCLDGRAVPCIEGVCTCEAVVPPRSMDAGVDGGETGGPSVGGSCAARPGRPGPSALVAVVGLAYLLSRRRRAVRSTA